ncbi:MAG: hypothetical protein B7Z68_01420 [Acidobacteria bacterium 21-70-11]|nr:MAG: hypothetical protein B7Z68_01420 [Acidobacteria bacterium 21-70-11]
MAGRAAAILGMLVLAHVAAAQFTQQGGKLVGSGAVGPAHQGYSVALSAHGNTAIVTGYGDDAFAGAAWVFTRGEGVWSQEGSKLVGADATGVARFGKSVAVSADGNTAIVSGPYDDANTGAAWLFTRSNGVWSQQGSKLVGTGAVGNAEQGWSAAISADGATAIVGGAFDNSNTGAAWVYTLAGGVWSQQGGKLVGTGAAGGAAQGYSVAISADGNTAILGGVADNSFAGAVWVFTRSAGVWSQQGGKLVGSDAVGGAFQGYSVAVSADGNTAIVGGYGDNATTGAAWVFTRSAGVWSQQGSKLVGSDAAGDAAQGWSVAISANGNAAAVGGPSDNFNAGAAWLYTRSAGAWSQQGGKLAGTGAVGAANQGAVAISADGTTVIAGGSYDDAKAGAAWVFVTPGCAPPVIAVQPQGRTILSGETATLSVTAAGTPALTYQWYQGDAGDTSAPVGADASTFTTPPLIATTSFWVRVSNACGAADSAAATITLGRRARRHLRRAT